MFKLIKRNNIIKLEFKIRIKLIKSIENNKFK